MRFRIFSGAGPARTAGKPITIYGLISRDELLRARSNLAIDVTHMRLPASAI